MQIPTYIKNSIFKSAKGQAKLLMTNRFRLAILLKDVAGKLNSIESRGKITRELKEKISVLSRLLKAFVTGRYKSLPWKAAISIVAATIYFLNPADIIPDFIPISGLLDDFTILIWTYNSLQSELDKFLAWEKSNLGKI
jgi:uncharacterized membrane protein YkvA (DUF1232 family)